ncbi:MAG: glycosyltransferase family 2 protein, partial [Hyphomicrobiales bacterium]|nr:glycosyltransferase family 2 protein [Hyphomicrobiales bacterium]
MQAEATASTAEIGAVETPVARPRLVPTLSIVVPTYNEKGNIRPLVAAVASALEGRLWEMIIVDDDSPDGTWREALAVARDGFPVRCIRRVGRRGLSSAVVEGAMSASAEIVGVMDADMQHDEKLLAPMLDLVLGKDPAQGQVDLVIASRHLDGGGLGDWDQSRRKMSSFATSLSKLVIGGAVSDPMSGFFMTRRSVFDAAVPELSQQGYKILLDLLSSSPQPLKIIEVPYVFRDRLSGESKLDVMILAEYAFLLIDKLSHGFVPPRFVLFSIVGGLGLIVHLLVLQLLQATGAPFLQSQAIATIVAMTLNFILNNVVTYRSQMLRGKDAVFGYFIFVTACSLGALANLSVANLAIQNVESWAFAGAAGAIMSAVFNFSVSTAFVWG